MVSRIDKILELKGVSGNAYRFDLFAFDSFEDLKTSFNPRPALYLFTKRSLSTGDAGYNHDLIYLGETCDLADRFTNHHKESCIMKHGSNCIGIFSASVDEHERKEQEKDLLNAYDFPCNEQNN